MFDLKIKISKKTASWLFSAFELVAHLFFPKLKISDKTLVAAEARGFHAAVTHPQKSLFKNPRDRRKGLTREDLTTQTVNGKSDAPVAQLFSKILKRAGIQKAPVKSRRQAHDFEQLRGS